MSTGQNALALMGELEALHYGMLEAGRAGDWEAAAANLPRVTAIVAALGEIAPATPEDRDRLAETIRQTLKLIAELQGIGAPLRVEWAEQLALEAQRNKLNDRYGV